MLQQVSPTGLFKQFSTSWQKLNSDLDASAYKFVEISSYLGVGFFSGLLIKKYFHYLLIVALSVGLTIMLAEEYGLVIVNWNKIQLVTGITANDTIVTISEHFVHCFKNNMVTSVSLLLGFIIGYKVG